MKKILIICTGAVSALLGACVNVDKETAEKPFVYWKAPEEAIPQKTVAPENIADDKILRDGQKAKPEKLFVRANDKVAAGERLDIADIIDVALENNQTTRIYWFQAKSYAAAVGKAQSSYYPQVSVSGEVYRSTTRPSLGYGGPFLSVGRYYETGFGPSAQINWLLCDFGARSSKVESARQALYAANFEYNRAIQEVVLNVNIAYYSLFEAFGSVKAAKLSVDDARTAYEAANERYKSGVGNKPDMLNALANLKTAEFSLESARSSVETARANLALAMGIRVNQKLNIDENLSPCPCQEAEHTIEALVASAFRARQDLLASYALLKKTQYDEEAARRSFLPQISAAAQGSITDYTQHGRSTQDNLQVGIGISWSIFEGFARKYDLISAQAARRAQAQTLKQTQIQIVADIWSAYYLYKSSLKQLASARAAVEANNEAYLAVKTGYENGVNSITDFLNAQNRLASARQQEVTALSTVSTSVAKLAYATGALSADSEKMGIIPTIPGEKSQN